MCEYPTLYDSKIVTAKKQHKCCEFGCKIKIGDKYELVKGCWDGHFITYKTCMKCVELANLVIDRGRDNQRMHGALGEEVWLELEESFQDWEPGEKFRLYRKYVEAKRRMPSAFRVRILEDEE